MTMAQGKALEQGQLKPEFHVASFFLSGRDRSQAVSSFFAHLYQLEGTEHPVVTGFPADCPFP